MNIPISVWIPATITDDQYFENQCKNTESEEIATTL